MVAETEVIAEWQRAQQLLREAGLGAQSLVLQRVSAGLSGAAVFQCQVDAAQYALRRWPASVPAQRVDQIHGVIRSASNQLSIVPSLVSLRDDCTWVDHQGGVYELATWMPGQPWQSAEADHIGLLQAVAAGGDVLAAFHDATRHWPQSQMPAPAALRRMTRLQQLARELPVALDRAETAALSPALRWAVRWLKQCADQQLQQAAQRLGPWTARMVPTRMALRDVHRHHILFDQGRPSGLVDFDALGIDAVSADLARWANGFLCLLADHREIDDAAVWESLRRGYGSRQAISQTELDLAIDLAEASWIIILGNWVVWILGGERDFSDCKATVDQRVNEIMRRMDPAASGTGL